MTTDMATNGSGTNGDAPLLEVKNLKMYFPVTSGIIFQRKIADVKAVDDVTFTINEGERMTLSSASELQAPSHGPCRYSPELCPYMVFTYVLIYIYIHMYVWHVSLNEIVEIWVGGL